jgi:hypothetical protein
MTERLAEAKTVNLPLLAAQLLAPYSEIIGRHRYEMAIADRGTKNGYQANNFYTDQVGTIFETWCGDNDPGDTDKTRITTVDFLTRTAKISLTYSVSKEMVTRNISVSPTEFCQITQLPKFLIRSEFLIPVATTGQEVTREMDRNEIVSEIVETKIVNQLIACRVRVRCGPVDLDNPNDTSGYKESILFENSLWHDLEQREGKDK